VENVDEIFQKIKKNRHVNSYDIAKELNMIIKPFWNIYVIIHKDAGYTKKLDLGAT